MSIINLDELYGGHWEWLEETYLFGIKHRSDDLDVKPLKDHLKEWIGIATDEKKLSFGCLNKDNKKAVTYMNDILEERIKTLDNDDGVIKFEYDHFWKNKNDEDDWCNEEDYVVFAPLELVKENIMKEARELGVKPRKTWYRDEVDWEAYKATHPDVDELPF
jgi:hypothetical protein